MPVEKDRIKGRLREIFPKANLSNKRLDELSARLSQKAADEADDAAIDQLLNDANDFMPFADIAREDDRLRTLESKAKSTTQEPEPPKTPNVPETPTDDVPKWAQSLLDEVKELKAGKVLDSKREQARKLFDKNETFKNLTEKGKEHFFAQIDVNSETPFDEQISELESTYTEIFQVKADNGKQAEQPPMGGNNNTPTNEELDSIIGKI